jgi:hypothetical protein
MGPATRVNSITADSSCAAKKPARDADPLLPRRKVHLPPVVGETIFLVRRVFETVLLPHLADGNACKGSMGGVQSRDRPVWSDCLRHWNEKNRQQYCGRHTNNLGASWSFQV